MAQRGTGRRSPRTRSRAPAAASAPEAAATPASWRATAALLLLLLVATAAAYTTSLDGGMQFDDSRAIEQNLAIKDLGPFLRETFWKGFGSGSRAVAELTFALNYAQARLEPRPYHLTSLLLHLAGVFVIFLLGRRLLQLAGWRAPEGPALAAAALWALHPANSQAVSYIVQRAEVLASLFYALAVLLVLEAARRGRRPAGLACYAGALLAALLGFESKPIVVSLPAAVLAALALARLPGGTTGRRAWLARLGLALPFGAAALRYGAGTVGSMAGHADAGFDIPSLQAASYPATQVRVVLAYLRQLAWPDGLTLDHDVVPSRSWLEPAVLGSGAALLLLCVGAGLLAWWASRPGRDERLGRAARVACFGLAWFFVLLSPTSSLVPLVDLMADHRPYLASWGVLLAVVVLAAAGLERALGSGQRAARAGLVATLILAGVLGVALHRRNAVWRDPAATWADVVEKAPRRWRGWQNLAQIAWNRGDRPRALELLTRALPLATTPEEQLATLRNMSANLIELGRLDRALDVLQQASELPGEDAGVQVNLAIVLAAKGRLDEAEARARRAVELEPGHPNAWATLGQIQSWRGDTRGALELFQRASALDPDALRPLQNMAAAQEALRLRPDACATWRRYAAARGGAGRAEAERQRRRLGCDQLEAGAR